MVHLGHLIQKRNSVDYKIIVVPDIIFWCRYKKIVSFQFKVQSLIYILIYFFISVKLVFKIKSKDSIFLMEYLLKERNQFLVARILRFFWHKKISIFGLAHLTPTRLELLYSTKELNKVTSMLECTLTLGTSLTEYLLTKGLDNNKVKTCFHYVDSEYYSPQISDNVSGKLRVIMMGMQMRDFSDLEEIIKINPEIHFVLCLGLLDLKGYFDEYKNLEVKGFMSEDQLKEEMMNADISLNLMIDTVGSNVITTSMAMGLVNIVSDVGSIRDYCSITNTYFCKSLSDYIHALKELDADRGLLTKMKYDSLNQSKLFRFDKFYSLLENI